MGDKEARCFGSRQTIVTGLSSMFPIHCKPLHSVLQRSRCLLYIHLLANCPVLFNWEAGSENWIQPFYFRFKHFYLNMSSKILVLGQANPWLCDKEEKNNKTTDKGIVTLRLAKGWTISSTSYHSSHDLEMPMRFLSIEKTFCLERSQLLTSV